jgi:hypothetical protein
METTATTAIVRGLIFGPYGNSQDTVIDRLKLTPQRRFVIACNRVAKERVELWLTHALVGIWITAHIALNKFSNAANS